MCRYRYTEPVSSMIPLRPLLPCTFPPAPSPLQDLLPAYEAFYEEFASANFSVNPSKYVMRHSPSGGGKCGTSPGGVCIVGSCWCAVPGTTGAGMSGTVPPLMCCTVAAVCSTSSHRSVRYSRHLDGWGVPWPDLPSNCAVARGKGFSWRCLSNEPLSAQLLLFLLLLLLLLPVQVRAVSSRGCALLHPE